jgi:hypothetical protein
MKISDIALIYDLQVIPNLVQTLTDDVRLRSLIAKFLSSIRNLSICIQEGAEMIKSTKGIFPV